MAVQVRTCGEEALRVGDSRMAINVLSAVMFPLFFSGRVVQRDTPHKALMLIAPQ